MTAFVVVLGTVGALLLAGSVVAGLAYRHEVKYTGSHRRHIL